MFRTLGSAPSSRRESARLRNLRERISVLIHVDLAAAASFVTSAAPSDRAFEALYRAHAAKSARLAAVLCGNAQRGEEIAAGAMVKVYRRWRRGGIDDFWPYLRVAVVNEFRSELRRDHSTEWELPDVAVDDLADLIGDRTVLLAALATLPARQRAAIALRYLEDLSERDAAALLRCEVGTIKSSVSRGLAALRVALGGDGHG